MKVSLNWIKQYLDFDLPPVEELARRIGAQLGAVEDIEDLGAKYKGVMVAKVVSCIDHPNSDHLHVCKIDDGGAVQDVERDEQGHVQVVCGAPNVREGMMVVWLPPGVVVPETAGKEPFTLTVRDIRGQKSNGMLASARELALGSDHSGILELNPHDAKSGDSFAKTYQLDDYIIDIENKMFTHRPDLFGELGVAREVAGILQHPFHSPDWYVSGQKDELARGNTLPLTVQNELPDLVPRFMAVTLEGITIHPSTAWLQTYLARVGIRPINNVVDITNYMMMESAQPLHAYDYDKVKALSGGNGAVLCVRHPHAGEKLLLLNGKEVTPREDAIMIATDKQAIGLGGVMGGGETEVDEHTKSVILECATFDMYAIRKMSMALGVFTDAVTRFNKGQSPLQNDKIMGESLRMFGQLASAKQASDIVDDNHVQGRDWVHPPVPVTAEFINVRLGLKLSATEMKRLLENVEFHIAMDGDSLTVTAPFWRTDIETREDVVEEVGRLYGYDKLPLELPARTVAPAPKDELLELKSRVRGKLVRSGANEVLTYSFVHGNLLDKVGQDKNQAFQVSNAISPDLQYYRLSLTPSLLDKVHTNIKAGYDAFALFEMGLVHHKGVMDEADGNVPLEDLHVALVFAAIEKGVAKNAGANYYEARKYLTTLLPTVEPMLVALKDFDFNGDVPGMQMCAPFEPNRSAVIVWNDLAWGVVGEYKAAVSKALKLPAHTAGFELGLEVLRHQPARIYQPLPRFPKVEQDICFKVASTVTYRQLYDAALEALDSLKPVQTRASLSPVDIYQREDDTAHKQITLRLIIASYEKTMTDTEVARLLDTVAAEVNDKLSAERV